MKKLLWIVVAVVALLNLSCSKEKEETGKNAEAKVPVIVRVGGFSVSLEDFQATRAEQDVAAYNNVKAITLAFYDGATETYKTTQYRSDTSTYTTFGEFSLSLPMGSYTMVVLAYGFQDGDVLTLTSPTVAAFTGDHARETFTATQEVEITSTDDAVELSATLSRVISKVQVTSTDSRTANAASVRTTFSAGGKSFNPTTGLATVDTGFSNTVAISSAVGSTSTTTSYLFLVTDEQTMAVTIDVLDSDGNSISHKVVSDVPLQRNRCTILKGSLYSAGATSTFQVETGWLSDTTVNF